MIRLYLKKILLCFSLCCLLWGTGGAEVQAMQLNNGWRYFEMEPIDSRSTSLIETHGEFIAGKHQWSNYQLGQELQLADDANCLLLSTRLPKLIHFNNPVLFFITDNQAVRVFLDNDLLYSSDEFNSEKKVYGTRWHMVTLPSNYLGRKLVLQLYSHDRASLGRVSSVSIDEGFLQTRHVFQHDIVTLCSIPLCTILIVILLMQYYSNRQAQRKDYIMVAFLLVLFMGYHIASSWTILYVFNMPDLLYNMNMLAVYLIPFSMMAIAYNNLHNEMKASTRIMIQIYMVLLFVIMGLEIIGIVPMHYIVQLQYQIASVMMLLVCLMLYHQGWKEDHHHCRRYFWPIMLTTVFNIVAGGLDVFYWAYRDYWYTQLNMLPMFFFVIWLIRHTIQEEQRLKLENKELVQEVRIVKRKAMIDHLTKCFTRGKYEETMEEAIAAAEEEGVPFSLLMFDLDFFKKVNDTYGHDMGDKVLVDFANIVRCQLDARHTFIRYGGEEFILICSAYDLKAAADLAEQLRAEIADKLWAAEVVVTTSIGIGTWHIGANDSREAIQKRADLALYYAKAQGRNKCVKETEIHLKA